MKHTEFWQVVNRAFPDGRGEALTQDLALVELSSMTPVEALSAGVNPQVVWNQIVKEMDLPKDFEYLHRKNQRNDG